jgi:hypothetical protein
MRLKPGALHRSVTVRWAMSPCGSCSSLGAVWAQCLSYATSRDDVAGDWIMRLRTETSQRLEQYRRSGAVLGDRESYRASNARSGPTL